MGPSVDPINWLLLHPLDGFGLNNSQKTLHTLRSGVSRSYACSRCGPPASGSRSLRSRCRRRGRRCRRRRGSRNRCRLGSRCRFCRRGCRFSCCRWRCRRRSTGGRCLFGAVPGCLGTCFGYRRRRAFGVFLRQSLFEYFVRSGHQFVLVRRGMVPIIVVPKFRRPCGPAKSGRP